MEQGSKDPDPQHELLAFHCNFETQDGEPCSQPLKECWITACSHLLCSEHAKEWFRNHDDCPMCRSGRVKLVRMDLSQASVRRRGQMSLVGMTPPEIVEASDTALSFWVDQKVFEFQRRGRRQNLLLGRQKSIEELIKSKLRDAEITCNTLEAEQQALQTKVDKTEQENRKVSEEVQRLKWDLAAAEERHKSLQKQVAGEHRQELFRRPLMEPPSPPRASTLGTAKSRSPMGHTGKASATKQASKAVGVSSNNAFQDCLGADITRASTVGEFEGPHSSRRLPTFTPGFLGTGRVAKRRIT